MNDQQMAAEPMDDRERQLRGEVQAYMRDRMTVLHGLLDDAVVKCLSIHEGILELHQLRPIIDAARDLGRAIGEQDAIRFHMHIQHPPFVLDEEMDSTHTEGTND